MTRDDIHKLIAGYATGTLSEEERKALFAAALEDQEIFDELAGEQEWKELIETPGVRSRLITSLEQEALEPTKKWWEQPHWTWAAAATVAAVLLGVYLIQPPEPKRLAMVMPEPPRISVAPVPFVEPPPVDQVAPVLPPPAAVRQAQSGATPVLPPPSVSAPPNTNAPVDAVREEARARDAAPAGPAAPAPAASRALAPAPPPPPAQQQTAGQLGPPAAGRGGGGRGGAVGGFVQNQVLQKATAAGFGFDYSITAEGRLRVVPSANGFLSVGAASQVVVSNRAVVSGSAAEVELPEGAMTATVVFSAQAITDSVLSVSKPPVDATPGTIVDPNPSPNSRLEAIVPIRH